MRIVVIGPTYPYKGGIAHYTGELVRSLASCEHEVSLVSFRRQYPGWLYPGRSDQDPSRQVQSWPASFLLDPICPISWRRTASLVASLHPEVVIMQWWTTYWAPAFAALGYLLRQNRSRMLYLVHNVVPHEPRVGDAQLTRLALHWGQAFITWNMMERQKLLPHIPPVPVELCPMPMCRLPTDSHIQPDLARKRLGLPDNLPIVLFFGYIRPYKGLRYLLESIAMMRAAGERVYLVIAGECWENRSVYLKMIQQLDLGSQVRLDDHYIRNEDVGAYFSAANVCVAPYIQESQSAVVTMALRFGIPLVVSESIASGLPRNPKDIRIVPRADPGALATAISEFCRNPMAKLLRNPMPDDGWDRLVHLVESFGNADDKYVRPYYQPVGVSSAL